MKINDGWGMKVLTGQGGLALISLIILIKIMRVNANHVAREFYRELDMAVRAIIIARLVSILLFSSVLKLGLR